jgi:dihydrofolate reductase
MIAATSLNGVIGNSGNKLPWGEDYPEDLFFFRKMTLGQTIIMGSKTFSSIGRALPKRYNIVVSQSDAHFPVDSTVRSYDEAFGAAANDAWIIGGASAYQAGLEVAEEIYITTIPRVITGRGLIYFPYVNPFQFTVKETMMIGEKLVCTVYKRAASATDLVCKESI